MIKWLEGDRYYRWCTYAFIPIQYAGLVFACWMWSSGKLSTVEDDRARADRRDGRGIAINTAHELGHKRDEPRALAVTVALAQSGYGHFYIEHNRGHHVRVATPEDPASARLGESFYAFWPRTVSAACARRGGWSGVRLSAHGPLDRGRRTTTSSTPGR